VTSIGADNAGAVTSILARLAGFGHRRVALVVPEGHYAFAEARIAAFLAAAPAHGIEIRTAPAAFNEDGGRATTVRLLGEPAHATAIVYFSSRMALGGLRAISDSVLVPGRHVSVISFGDNGNLLYASPPITAVAAPIDEMAHHTIDVLIAAIDGKPIEPIRRWPLTLVWRQSDGPLVARPPLGAWLGGESLTEPG
jgi:DNA-binding LacI/PurR family transcriptional regulator